MTHIHFIGCGRIASITMAMLAVKKGKEIYMTANDINLNKKGEILDLKCIAYCDWNDQVPQDADLYVVTAGIPRRNTDQSKVDLFLTNSKIVIEATSMLKKDDRIIVITNPPTMLAEILKKKGFNASPFGIEVDRLRASTLNVEVWGTHEELKGDPNNVALVKAMNDEVLNYKGHTEFTPAFVLMNRIIGEIE